MTDMERMRGVENMSSVELGQTIEDLIATDIERNLRLAKTLMYLLGGCTQMVNDIETLAAVLREHDIPLPDGVRDDFQTVQVEVCGE